MTTAIILVSVGFISLLYIHGIKNGIYFFLVFALPVGIFTGLLSEGYFFGDIGRYLFLIIIIPVAIIYNNKKYKEYFIKNVKKYLKSKKINK
jgi:hypothetical protein